VFQELIKRIAVEFSLRKIPYMIIGGQAVLLYGEPRLTKDIDITLGVGIEEFDGIADAVTALGLKVQVADAKAFVMETMVLPALDVPFLRPSKNQIYDFLRLMYKLAIQMRWNRMQA